MESSENTAGGAGEPVINVAMTLYGEEAKAFREFMRAEAIKLRSVAGTKLVIERLRERGLLKDEPALAQ